MSLSFWPFASRSRVLRRTEHLFEKGDAASDLALRRTKVLVRAAAIGEPGADAKLRRAGARIVPDLVAIALTSDEVWLGSPRGREDQYAARALLLLAESARIADLIKESVRVAARARLSAHHHIRPNELLSALGAVHSPAGSAS